MNDPLTTITAGAILNLAFQAFAKSGAGELGKKTVDGLMDKIKALRDLISAKLKGNEKAEAAIATLKTAHSQAVLTKLEVYLDDAMSDDAVFAAELRQLAQQIINIQNQTTSNREYKNYGRDQINIETIEGNPKIGGS